MRTDDLRARLARVCGHRPPPATALASLPDDIAARLSPSLAERLARLRPLHGDLGPRRPSDADAARHLDGDATSPGLVRIVRRYPTPMPHGVVRLQSPSNQRWRNAAFTALRDRRIGFIDTETTGLAGGTGTIAFVAGLATVDARSVTVTQWVLLGFGAEAAMLEALADGLAGVSAVVSYNGKSFDAPLLQTRYRMHGKADPFAGMEHLDLLPWTRAHRPASWEDAKLQTVERGWLGIKREDDIAGADVPAAWRAWLDRGAMRDLGRVVRHNRIDILSLAALFQRALEHQPDDLLKDPPAKRLRMAGGRSLVSAV